jgi:hypothetical protein
MMLNSQCMNVVRAALIELIEGDGGPFFRYYGLVQASSMQATMANMMGGASLDGCAAMIGGGSDEALLLPRARIGYNGTGGEG